MGHQYDNRRVFLDAQATMQKLGLNVKDAVLSQSYLRFETLAATNTTNYNFGILVNDSSGNGQPVRATESRLQLQDAFYIAQIQVLIGLADSNTSTNFPVYAWNNPAIFTTSGAAPALNNFYNGYLKLTVNNKVITPGWDLLRHKTVNQTQFTAATNSPLDQFNGGLEASFPSEPNWCLIGSKNNSLQAILPAAIDTLQASKTTVLTVIMRGVLAQNVTVVS